MSLKNLRISDDTEMSSKKEATPFEQRRAAATTYEELVALGYEEGMDWPEEWAERVINARNNF